jgi:hypothetical protein
MIHYTACLRSSRPSVDGSLPSVNSLLAPPPHQPTNPQLRVGHLRTLAMPPPRLLSIPRSEGCVLPRLAARRLRPRAVQRAVLHRLIKSGSREWATRKVICGCEPQNGATHKMNRSPRSRSNRIPRYILHCPNPHIILVRCVPETVSAQLYSCITCTCVHTLYMCTHVTLQ